MDIQQLVHASEILENLEQIQNQIEQNNKHLSKEGLRRIDEIIEDCCNALSVNCECGNKGRKEYERINTLILQTSRRIKHLALGKQNRVPVLA